MKSVLLLGLCLVAVGAGCKKGDGATGGDTAAEGCGKDLADPGKMFCITVPAGWTVDPKIDTSSPPYTEIVKINGPAVGDNISVAVGFSSTNSKKYEDELAYAERLMKSDTRKVTGSGATPGNDGKWWTYTDRGSKIAQAVAKSPDGKALICNTANSTPSAAANEPCKSIRPYPTKK